MEVDRVSDYSDTAYHTLYCSIAEAVKLINHPFNGDKKCLLD